MTRDERLGPPPIEPLSDTAWSRIERGVWSELDAEMPAHPARRARRWLFAGGALVAAAAIALLVLGLRASSAPVAFVDEPSRVVSGSAPSTVSFGDAHIELDADTALMLSRDAGHPIVLIERGAAWFTVAPRAGRPEFIVRAGDASVRVVGTRFRVARSDERIAVEVDHGVVAIRFRGAVTAVGARQQWSSTSPTHATEIARAADPTAAGTTSPATAGVLDSTRGPEPAPSAEAAPPVNPPVVADPRAAAGSPARPHRPRPAASPTGAPAAIPAKPGSHADPERAEYDRLAALEPVRPEAALDGYLALARGTGVWAEPALFAAARLAADRGDRRAATLLGMYLQRAPTGANAADARRLLERLKGHP